MGLFDKLRDAAARAAGQAAEGAERLAKHVAQHGPGFLAESASEMLAEREYDRARELSADGITAAVAQEIIAILTPYAKVDCSRNVLIAYLLADAHHALDHDETAREYYERALDLLRDPSQRRDAEPQILEELDILGDEFEARLLVALAGLASQAADWDGCIRYCLQAIQADRHAHTAFYLQGYAMLRKGLPHDVVAELFSKALSQVDGETVLGWVRELLPEHVPWFERLTR